MIARLLIFVIAAWSVQAAELLVAAASDMAPLAPALANALRRATGKPQRELPFKFA